MKVYLIKASAGSSFSEYKKMTGGPPQNIFATAAATPAGIQIEMVDETIGMKVSLKSQADVIVVFMSTPDALRAYEIADHFRKEGRTVVLGGLHTAFQQEEALEHADAIMIGEVEGIWPQLLEDIARNTLKRKYRRTVPVDLAELKPYPLNLIPMKKYNYTWSVVVSRGCPFQCSFCLVPTFANKHRLRPIEDIVAEIQQCPVEWIELHSDNLTANRDYALELFRALKPFKKKFFAETTILIAKDDELLQAAYEAGIKAMLFGIETMSSKALKDQSKGFVKPDDVKRHVKHIQSYGITVLSDFLFGFDAHDESVFKETLDYIKDVGFDEVYPHLLIPFPGSKTFKKLEKEGRILTKDWSQYDGSHAVYQPKQMSPEALEAGTYWVWQESERLKKKRSRSTGLGASSVIEAPSTEEISDQSQMVPWKSLVALVCIVVGIILNLYWVWGILFIVWVINDLRNGWTYLLDIIQRKTHPLLYWIIVSLWFFLGVWIIFFSPIAYVYNLADSAQASPAYFDKQLTIEDELSQDYITCSERYGVTIKAPYEWKISRELKQDSEVSEFIALNDQASLSVLCVELQAREKLEDFIVRMRNDLQRKIFFTERVQKNRQETSVEERESGTFEYNGLYCGHDVIILVRYSVHGSFGCVLIGMSDILDTDMDHIIRQSFNSVVIREPDHLKDIYYSGM